MQTYKSYQVLVIKMLLFSFLIQNCSTSNLDLPSPTTSNSSVTDQAKEQINSHEALIKRRIDEFWDKTYSPAEELLFEYFTGYEQDYIARAGEILYLALKERHLRYIKDIFNLNNERLGVTPETPLSKKRLVGYALCLVIKDIEFNLRDVFEIITTEQEFTSIIQMNSTNEYIALSWIEAIRQGKGNLIKLWKTRLKQLYAIKENNHWDFNDIVCSLVALLSNHEENKQIFSIEEYKQCFRYIEFSDEQLELLKSSKNFNREVQQQLLVLIEQYKKSKRRLNTCTPIQRRHNQLTMSKKREENKYSDSEEEEAPHFNGVYNLTKSKMYDLDYDMDDIVEKDGCPIDIDDYLCREDAGEVINNYVMGFNEIYPDKLKKDAQEISAGLDTNLTVLCAALQQPDGRTKKFVFTNECSLSQWKSENLKYIATKAHMLKYHVVMTQGSHAEGGLMQFLQERPNRYSHIIALGCSREYCDFCYDMLKKFMGVDFKLLDISTSGLQKFDHTPRYWCFPSALAHFCRENMCFPNLPKEVLEESLRKMKKCNCEEDGNTLSAEKWKEWKNHEPTSIQVTAQIMDDTEELTLQPSYSKSLKRKRETLEDESLSTSTSISKNMDLKDIKS